MRSGWLGPGACLPNLFSSRSRDFGGRCGRSVSSGGCRCIDCRSGEVTRESRDRSLLLGSVFASRLLHGRFFDRNVLLRGDEAESEHDDEEDDSYDTGQLLDEGGSTCCRECRLGGHAAEPCEAAHLVVLHENEEGEEQAEEHVDDDENPKECCHGDDSLVG